MDDEFSRSIIDQMKDDAFAVVFTGEVPDSHLVHGFDEMLKHVQGELGCALEELEDIRDSLSWKTTDDDLPLVYETEFGEGVYITICRINSLRESTTWYTESEIEYWLENDHPDVKAPPKWIAEILNRAFEKGRQIGRGERKEKP